MIAVVRLASLATMSLGLGALLSCRQATQITVELRGEGFACKPSAGEPGYAASGVLARAQLTGAGDLAGPRADGSDDDCTGANPVELGSVVLVPAAGVGPVEVLAIAALTPTDGPAPSIDDCQAVYEAFLADGVATCAPTDPCAACIFARRSLGFVEYSNLDLTITLDNDCAGVLCEASKTCVPERGCVSAAVECSGESCNVPDGTGGAGGGGGSGGGPAAGWQQLEVPPEAFPLDVVGATATVEGDKLLALFVAAGPYMLTYRDRTLTAFSDGADEKAFVAVAVEAAGNRVAAVGSLGVAVAPDFTPNGPAYGPLIDFDIAWRSGHSGPDVATDDGTADFPNCVSGFGNASAEAVCGTALFAVATPLGGDVLLGASGSVQMYDDGELSSFSPPDPSAASSDWSLWGRPRSASVGEPLAVGYAVRSESSIIRFSAQNGILAREDLLSVASGNPAGIVIDAVWGVARSDGVALYAVGERNGSGWLARAQVDDDASDFEGWQELATPPAFTRLRSVWVGPDPQLDGALVLVVAGSVESNNERVAIIPLSEL